jgi:hypothetical protein
LPNAVLGKIDVTRIDRVEGKGGRNAGVALRVGERAGPGVATRRGLPDELAVLVERRAPVSRTGRNE